MVRGPRLNFIDEIKSRNFQVRLLKSIERAVQVDKPTQTF